MLYKIVNNFRLNFNKIIFKITYLLIQNISGAGMADAQQVTNAYNIVDLNVYIVHYTKLFEQILSYKK